MDQTLDQAMAVVETCSQRLRGLSDEAMAIAVTLMQLRRSATTLSPAHLAMLNDVLRAALTMAETAKGQQPASNSSTAVGGVAAAAPAATPMEPNPSQPDWSQDSAELEAEHLGITDEGEIKKLKQRNNVLAEVVETEITYCASLETISEHYYEPMKADLAPGCTQSDFKAIFGAFGSLLEFHRGLLPRLQTEYAQLANNDDRSHYSARPIALLFKQWAPGLKFYPSYVSNLKAGLERVEQLKRVPASKDWLEGQSQKCKRDLVFLLGAPNQRVPRYRLLFAELIQCTPDWLAEEKRILEDVKTLVANHCDTITTRESIDDSRAKCGALHRLFRMQDLAEAKQRGDLRALETVEGLPDLPGTGLMQPYRWLVLDESEASEMLSSKSDVRVLVFNDLILIVEQAQEWFTGREYLLFRDKLDLGTEGAKPPAMRVLGTSPLYTLDVEGTAHYAYDGSTRNVKWRLQFPTESKRDGFIAAVREGTQA